MRLVSADSFVSSTNLGPVSCFLCVTCSRGKVNGRRKIERVGIRRSEEFQNLEVETGRQTYQQDRNFI